ncbi:hypothetical protein FrCorBMG51_19950, partial [Protofrankia coriariae]
MPVGDRAQQQMFPSGRGRVAGAQKLPGHPVGRAAGVGVTENGKLFPDPRLPIFLVIGKGLTRPFPGD